MNKMEDRFKKALCYHEKLTTVKIIEVLWKMKKGG